MLHQFISTKRSFSSVISLAPVLAWPPYWDADAFDLAMVNGKLTFWPKRLSYPMMLTFLPLFVRDVICYHAIQRFLLTKH